MSTPGPWFVQPWSSKEYHITAFVDGKETSIAGYCLASDALVIGAAPNLLKAAIATLEYITSVEQKLGTELESGNLLREAIDLTKSREGVNL